MLLLLLLRLRRPRQDADKAKAADKERSEKIQKWVGSTTMDDVVWDDDEDKRIVIGSHKPRTKRRASNR